jgi:predicted AlkP superfamily pyrophosphatase or phosphodiesterase
MRLALGLLVFLAALAGVPAQAAEPQPNPLIVISIDGFRADYFDRGLTPTLAALTRDGVHARAMHPSFPSLTYPNHYTLVTGLYPDHHGVIENVMWDARVSPDMFTMNSRNSELPGWWEEAKPLWESAQEQGRIVASGGWPGSEALIHKHRPNYLDVWRDHRKPEEQARMSLSWADLPAAWRPSIQFLYFDDVDHGGHDFGPESPQVDDALRQVDAALALLVAGLKKRGVFESTNIVIVSDHGMADTSDQRTVILEDILPPGIALVRSAGASAGLDPVPGHESELAALLLAPHPHFTCWRKAEIPARLHYGANPRIPEFLCLSEAGWRFASRTDKAYWTKPHPGSHGYDPADPAMNALFLAHGPAFRRGVTLKPFDNVDVYPLLAKVSGVGPEKNDGNLADLTAALK